jgi:tetratricopeptide (TPR) repeat protein
MKRKIILLIATFLVIGAIVNGQTIAKPDSVVNEKARYQKENLDMFLARNAKYPKEGTTRGIEGNVVLSFVVTRNGKLDSLSLESSPNEILTTSSISTFNEIVGDWVPAKINNVPIDKRYFLVFRYRIYMDTEPFDYKAMANKYFKKQKYEKALKLCNEGIRDNQYDHQLFELRAEVKEMLGDMEGAKLDRSLAIVLDDEIMGIVGITAIGVTRTVRTISRTTTMGRPNLGY